MLLLYFALIGAAASRAFRWPGLLLVVSILAVALGVESALDHRGIEAFLVEGGLMLLTVEAAYVVASLLWLEGAQPLSHRKA